MRSIRIRYPAFEYVNETRAVRMWLWASARKLY